MKTCSKEGKRLIEVRKQDAVAVPAVAMELAAWCRSTVTAKSEKRWNGCIAAIA